jgi:hypothetical protein
MAGARVSGCGSGSRKKARAGSNCKRRLSLRWLPPVERVGGADMMSYNRPAILPMLKRASLFGLDGNGKQLIIVESADLNLHYLDI